MSSCPKGFFPVQDTGVILGISEAPQSISFPAMAERQQALAGVILKDPAVASLSSFIGVDGTNTTLNSGRIQINLKPLDERRISASDVIRRLQPQLATVEGITLFMQPVQDLTVEDRVSRTQYQYTLEDADPEELNRWAPKLVEALADASGTARREQRSAGPGAGVHAGHRPQHGLAPGHHAAADRRHPLRRLRPAAGVDDVHPVEPVSRRAGGDAGVSAGPTIAAVPRCPVPERRPGAVERVHPGSRRPPTPLVISRQGQFPAVTLSFNLAPGVSLGDAVDGDRDGPRRSIGLPPSIRGSFQGTAQAFQASLANEPLLILAALVTVYIVLGILYESYIHPMTILSTLPSAGRRGAAGADALPDRVQRHRADRHHSADRHREEERHHDDRLCPGGRAQGREAAGGGDL